MQCFNHFNGLFSIFNTGNSLLFLPFQWSIFVERLFTLFLYLSHQGDDFKSSFVYILHEYTMHVNNLDISVQYINVFHLFILFHLFME